MTCVAIKYHMWRTIIIIFFFYGDSMGKKHWETILFYYFRSKTCHSIFTVLNERTNLRVFE